VFVSLKTRRIVFNVISKKQKRRINEKQYPTVGYGCIGSNGVSRMCASRNPSPQTHRCAQASRTRGNLSACADNRTCAHRSACN
jgi:hypothetical protein